MTFLYESLWTFGWPLLALPLVIHLINLRRRKRIEWGAMQFLLESQKRNRKWIILRQLLLLLLRTAAIAAVVLMLAGPVVQAGWASLLGRGVTHHLILLDDSYSMSDHWNETSAFDEAKRVASRLLEQARGRKDAQVVTLLRFSEARKLAAGSGPKIDKRPLDAELVAELERTLGTMRPSETDAGPVDVLEAASRLPEPPADETRIVYLVSDFRKPQWEERSQLRQLVSRLRERTAKLLLVQCVDQTRPNLAIDRLAPESGVRAAGVETWFEATVTNYGDEPAAAPTVAIEQDGAKLPAVEFDDIPAGESATRRFRASLAGAGSHWLSAALEADAVETDNHRYFAAEIPATFPVLVIDGSAQGDDGYFLSNALSPGGKNIAGWKTQVEPVSFLRKHEALGDFAAILLCDVPRLDAPEVEALEAYVKAGGGLAVFLGSQSQKPFYNSELYRDGTGLLPAPLGVPTQLLRDSESATPDIVVGSHPLFRVFGGQRNSFLAVAKVDFYYALDPNWKAPPSGDVNVLARLRNGAPFVVEKQFGAGRVVVELCKLSPQADELGAWSNWSVNPAFPVYANELVGYLSATRRASADRGVESPVEIVAPEAEFLPEGRVRPPGSTESASLDVSPTARDGKFSLAAPGNAKSGVWEFQLKTRDGKDVTRYVAVNVPTGEGDLHALDRDGVAERLKGIDYDFAMASDVAQAGEALAGFRLSDALVYALLAMLLVEQLLAASASYHPAAGRNGA